MTDPELDRQLTSMRTELAALRKEVARTRRDQGRGLRVRLFWLSFGVMVAFSASTAAQLVTFNPNTPALASQINANFEQLKIWIEQKVGTVGNSTVSVGGNLTVAGEVGNNTGAALNLYDDADIVGADLIEGYNDLRLSGKPGNGNDLLIENGGNVSVQQQLTVNANAVINGDENDGSAAALKVVSGSQTLSADGNEIDSNGTLFLNSNSGGNVQIGAGILTGQSCTTHNTGFNDDGDGQAWYLDRHDVSCAADKHLKRFRLVRNANNTEYRFDYTCCTY